MTEHSKPSVSFSSANRDQLIQEHAHLVDKIAKRIIARLPSNVELDDLKSVGIIGLIDAIEKYSDDKGNHFRVYAEIRIRGAIMDELRSQDWVPRSVRDRQNLIKKEYQKLSQHLGRSPSDQEMADGLEMSLEDFQSFSNKALGQTMISYEDRLTRIETVLWGTDGKNGLRSDIRELKRKMDMLLRFFWVATAIPPLVVSVLAVLKFFDKL